nr:hypothetical protein CFP56_73694 [Quercus suber]
MNFGLNNNSSLLISEQKQPTVDLSLARANFAGQGNSRGDRGGRQNSSPALGRGSPYSNQKNNRGQGCGRGNGNSSSTTRPVCLVCNKTGHSTLNCYHQYDNSNSTN